MQFETLDLEENLDCNIIQLSPSSNAVKSEVDNSDLDDAIQEIITDMIEVRASYNFLLVWCIIYIFVRNMYTRTRRWINNNY